MPGLPGLYRLFPIVSGPRAQSVLILRAVQAGYTTGLYEVHGPRVSLGVPVLQVPCPAGFQCFECGACPAPDVGTEAFLGLAFVAELEGAQFAVDQLQVGDLAVVEGSAVEDEVEEVVPGAVG
jgi:hypothetical protein